MVTLPLDGRNFVPLIALAPGVNLPPGNLLPRINGSRPRVSEYIYDGISVLQPEPGQVAFYPIVDAIERGDLGFGLGHRADHLDRLHVARPRPVEGRRQARVARVRKRAINRIKQSSE